MDNSVASLITGGEQSIYTLIYSLSKIWHRHSYEMLRALSINRPALRRGSVLITEFNVDELAETSAVITFDTEVCPEFQDVMLLY
jgi:hypothetical protein